MRRIGHILAIALITAGLVVLADVGLTLAYKEPVSSIYGQIQQDQAADQLSELEANFPTPADRRALRGVKDLKARVSILARRFGRQVGSGDAIGRIIAPDMDGLNAVVVEGTDTADLRKGPGHFPETPFPGERGTVGVAGHRTTYLAPFRHIDSMERGDPVTLEMPYATFVYRVQRTDVVDPGDHEVVDPVGYERLVLSACHPLYSAAQRYIVFARLSRIRPPAG
jgi:sortase A